jgi:type IV pilus assembly protein PilQ
MLSLVAAPSRAQVAGARPYTTITDIQVSTLSNGVQVRIVANGLLQYRNQALNGREMRISFPDARNGTGKNFFNVNSYPVSYLQLATPQGAVGGIGLDLTIRNLIETSASLAQSPDRTEVLLTINSDRTLENASGIVDGNNNGPTLTDNSTKTEVVAKNGLLSVRAVKADIHVLVAMLAREAHIAVAVDDGVKRDVSLNLQGLAPMAALQAIATANGLALSQTGGLYVLAEGIPTDLATYRLSNTESYRMQNTQAQNASGLLPNFLYSYVKVNPEQNAIVVTAPSQMLGKIGDDLQKMDVPAPQISIEAIAVEMSDTNELNLGVRLGSTTTDALGTLNPAGGTISYNTIGKLPDNFEVQLHALELKGKARVRARPRMAVINGRNANIFIGAQRFILTQFNQYGQTQNRIQPVDVGVKLGVTPLTGGNGEITIRLTPEVSNITDLDLQTGLPLLSTRRADTTVRVKDGETIAIGGLTLSQEQTKRGKIPLLGDIPLIGRAFRTKTRNDVRTELVVFVTPRILDGNGDAASRLESTPASPGISPTAAK